MHACWRCNVLRHSEEAIRMSTQDQYRERMFRAVCNDLTEMQLRYDTRVLATAMIDRSVFLLRALVAAGTWTAADVQAVAMEALADLHEPLDVEPRVMTLRPGDLSSESDG
jgi:hypothetical protein